MVLSILGSLVNLVDPAEHLKCAQNAQCRSQETFYECISLELSKTAKQTKEKGVERGSMLSS